MRTHAGRSCYRNAHCGQGVVTVTNTPVNSMAIVKEQYGDLNDMNEDEITEFSELAQGAAILIENRE